MRTSDEPVVVAEGGCVDNRIRGPSATMLGLSADNWTRRPNAIMLGLRVDEISPPASTTGEVTVTFSVGRTDDAPHGATILTPKTDPEEKSDGVEEGFRRYNDMLATIRYAADHHEDGAVGDGATYYDARATFTTTGMNTGVTTFEPAGQDSTRRRPFPEHSR